MHVYSDVASLFSAILHIIPMGYIGFLPPTPTFNPITTQNFKSPLPQHVCANSFVVLKLMYLVGVTGPCTTRGYCEMSRTVPKWVKEAKPHYCAACGRGDDLQYHHLTPKSKGGVDIPSNIIVLCAECHQKLHGQGGDIKHNHLVRDGIIRARGEGVFVGRKPADAERIMRLIAENSTQFQNDKLITENEIMEIAGVKPVCYHKYKRRLLLLMDADEWPFEWDKPKKLRGMPMYDRVIKRLRGDKTA